MKHPLFSRVALAADLPKEGLQRGDVATIVEYYEGRPGQEPGYELEVFNAVGDTLAVVTVRESQVEPLRTDEILTVRQRETTKQRRIVAITDGHDRAIQTFTKVARDVVEPGRRQRICGAP